MASQLIYTSAERGLKPRTHGFCTVAMTAGLSPGVVERLEGLSGYRAYYPAHDPNAASNPVNFSYYRFTIGGRDCAVLSRVAFAGFDYSGRSNVLAQHFLLDEPDRVEAGPTRMAAQSNLFLRTWMGEPRWIEPAGGISMPPRVAGIARTWQELSGDAGWAGVIAEHAMQSLGGGGGSVAILYPPELRSDRVLRLLDEAMGLIPPERRWEVTFSTYLTDLPTGTTCLWRCMLPDSPEWAKIRRNSRVLCVDLTKGRLPAAAGGRLVAAARSGENLYPETPAQEPARASSAVRVQETRETPPVLTYDAAKPEEPALRPIPKSAPPPPPAEPPSPLWKAAESEQEPSMLPYNRSRSPKPRRRPWLLPSVALAMVGVGIGGYMIKRAMKPVAPTQQIVNSTPQVSKGGSGRSASSQDTPEAPPAPPSTESQKNPAPPSPDTKPVKTDSHGSPKAIPKAIPAGSPQPTLPTSAKNNAPKARDPAAKTTAIAANRPGTQENHAPATPVTSLTSPATEEFRPSGTENPILGPIKTSIPQGETPPPLVKIWVSQRQIGYFTLGTFPKKPKVAAHDAICKLRTSDGEVIDYNFNDPLAIKIKTALKIETNRDSQGLRVALLDRRKEGITLVEFLVDGAEHVKVVDSVNFVGARPGSNQMSPEIEVFLNAAQIYLPTKDGKFLEIRFLGVADARNMAVTSPPPDSSNPKKPVSNSAARFREEDMKKAQLDLELAYDAMNQEKSVRGHTDE